MAFQDCDNFVREYLDVKPTIECRLLSGIVLGQKVAIVPYNHPSAQFNGKQCLTSGVTLVMDELTSKPTFETSKAIYVIVG
jgi:hypothetical protein